VTVIWTTARETFATTFSRELSNSRSKVDDADASNLTAAASADRWGAVDCARVDAHVTKQTMTSSAHCNLVMSKPGMRSLELMVPGLLEARALLLKAH
jgi:hypothetical protein